MAAFGGEGTDTEPAFQAHWDRMLRDPRVVARTILVGEEIVGWVGQFELLQKPAVAVWVGREYWGRGVATRALSTFLREVPTRPLYARVAKDNHGSQRVVAKCGFALIGQDKGFARFRGAELEELIYELR